ncbi:MAG: TonB-dependent receptor plug domain-containing protein, partial [Ferruginibacter sp.]
MLCLKTSGQSNDSLPEVILNSKKVISISNETVPVYQLQKKVLSQLNIVSVAEALKFVPGALVKDYGGLGGLKTVSIRSLGANHTVVLYDGVPISGAQSGIVDLGKISLDNIESVTLYQSQPLSILMTAKSFASASIIALNTQTRSNDTTKKFTGKASINVGSFKSIITSTSLQYSISKNWFGAFSAGWQKSEGNYTYKSYVNNKEEAKRNNSNINSFRMELDFSKIGVSTDKIKLKAYYYQSERGLPGSVVFYNAESNQSLFERNVFLQGVWNIDINEKNKLLLSGKLSYDLSDYIDPNFQNANGRMQNTFHQREAFASVAYSYKISEKLMAAYASDFFITNLKRTDIFAYDFVNPTRLNFLNNISFYANLASVKIRANILATNLRDDVKAANGNVNEAEISPAISFTWQPLKKLPIKIRAFYKDIFRAPTFNDLYYTNVGNTSLRPEYVKEFNAGLTWEPALSSSFKNIEIAADAYLNKIHDKIIAVPRQNIFQWTMLNIGEVEIKGLDISTRFILKELRKMNLSGMISYTYQQALDITNKNSTLYKSQLPYVPIHSGSAHANVDYARFNMSYNILFSGDRYRLGDPVIDNLVSGFATQDISIGYYSFINKYKVSVKAEINNLSNKNYEVIKFYPMP